MGSQHGEATSFNWKWHYSAGKWIIWLALVAAFAIPQANRNIRILLILIPLGIVNLLWWIFMKYANMNSTDALQFSIIFNSMAVSMTVLWLVTNYFKRFRGAVRFLLSFVVIVGVASLGTLAYSTEFSTETAMFLVLFAFMTLTILIAITLSRRLCGGTYHPVCFMLWLVLWMFIGSLIITSGFVFVCSIIFTLGPDSSAAILIFIIGGSVFGLFLYVLNLPFMILGFAHPLFRERFCACLGFKSIPATVESEAGSNGFEDVKS